MQATHSLRSRIALLVALLVGALGWLLGALIGHDSSLRMRDEIGQDLAEVSFQMIDRLDRDMADRAKVLQVLSQLRALRQPDDIAEVRTLLDSLQHELHEIAWIGYTDPAGTVRASSDGVLEGASLSQRPVYINGIKGLFIGDVHEAVLLAKLLPNPTGEAMKFVDIAMPVKAWTAPRSGCSPRTCPGPGPTMCAARCSNPCSNGARSSSSSSAATAPCSSAREP